ncbi:hypothetical protein SAMN06272765_6757 [Streptomyces sp. Ag109_G2-15]|nr:hypothetical protein SAMN06272765_6757 [Streptomyces sp. Ag109_G2-15]
MTPQGVAPRQGCTGKGARACAGNGLFNAHAPLARVARQIARQVSIT